MAEYRGTINRDPKPSQSVFLTTIEESEYFISAIDGKYCKQNTHSTRKRRTVFGDFRRSSRDSGESEQCRTIATTKR
jgi:hypothetical protein